MLHETVPVDQRSVCRGHLVRLNLSASGFVLQVLPVSTHILKQSSLMLLDGYCAEHLLHPSVVCRFAVTASEDSTARVWDLQTQPLPALQRHSTRVHAIAPSAGGTTVTTLGGRALPSFGPCVWRALPWAVSAACLACRDLHPHLCPSECVVGHMYLNLLSSLHVAACIEHHACLVSNVAPVL